MKPIDKNVGEYDLTAEKKAGMITGTIRGELPDSDANLPLVPFSGTFAGPAWPKPSPIFSSSSPTSNRRLSTICARNC
ncbi:Uncharacterised protein [Serratia marcescens]|uniref:Uncharacterized protein n=1 Tax=Serratia marcescens TaxID=615 RepID=A0A380ARA8_SERMA|nr:Uncharacterised protein [Serratia marcescens]